MDKNGTLLKGIAVVLALALLATLVDAALMRHQLGPQQKPRVLTVQATAYAEAEPDVARISLGVKATRATPREAAAQVAKTVAAIKGKLGSLGVGKDAVETSELYLGEATQWNNKLNRDVRIGYKAYHWLRVTLKQQDFAKLAAVCDGAVAAGATSFSGLVFEVDDDTALRAQALEKATARARQKAEAMAKGAGARLVGVQSIAESYGYGYGGVEYARRPLQDTGAPAAAAAGGMAAAEAPPGEPAVPGKLRMDCDVEVVFLLKS